MSNWDIVRLRDVELDPKLAAQLAPFMRAYAPHDAAPTRSELRELDPVEVEGFTLEDIADGARALCQSEKRTPFQPEGPRARYDTCIETNEPHG